MRRRRDSLHDELRAQEARVAPDAETAEQRLARLARRPIVLGAAAAVGVVVLKVVAHVAGVGFVEHPRWIAAAIFVVALTMGVSLTLARARHTTDGVDDG